MTAWYLQPPALSIIETIRDDPPRRVHCVASLLSWFAGGDEFATAYDRNDERVDELRVISNAAFRAAEAAGATVDELLAWPSLEAVIDAALGVGEPEIAAAIDAALALGEPVERRAAA